ncbi:MAG: hypothetical protein HYY43_04280, partial [Deltaproteobacteria bacterium]|nr:hypothetical protein [Deltaproteobacteria bacterium]
WLVAGDKEKQIEWDRIIDYSADPMWKAYSRPVPGDYDGDNWLDTALQTPDGHWLIDYGGYKGGAEEGGITIHVNEDGTATVDLANPLLSKLGQFDKDVKYLTDEQLAQAPGWAWLPATDNMTSIKGNIVSDILIRVPDGLANEGKLFVGEEPDYFLNDTELPAIYGSNDVFFTTAIYDGEVGCTGFGLKHVDGTWQVSFCGTWEIFKSPTPDSGYGDIICRPVPADYDGDGKDDRAVQCGTSWKIAYSNGAPNFREVELDQALDPVPAYVYPGGIKYQDTVDLYSYYKTELGGTKTSTIFDALPPIGPYFAQCVKYWAPNASYCWDK